MDIRLDDLSGDKIRNLLTEHIQNMTAISPRGSMHALDVTSLQTPSISFWTVWDGEELLGCGALKQLDETSGEIKSMRTAQAHRRRGVGARMLRHILAEAGQRGYKMLYLETGAQPPFEPARSMYLNHGFRVRGPFGSYVEDPNSVFMELVL